MPIWLRKSFGAESYSDAFDRLDGLMVSTGLHRELLMVADNDGDGPTDVVYIWLVNETHALLFPEFEEIEPPELRKPVLLIGDYTVYEKHFP